MTKDVPSETHRFLLQAIDSGAGRVVFEALFHVRALDELRVLLGPEAEEDAELHDLYYPDPGQLRAINERFGIAFDAAGFLARLHNLEIRGPLPYRFHSGYELPMLLDGTKRFGFIDHFYPPHHHDGEDEFDRCVADGRLHKEAVVEPYDEPRRWGDGRITEGFRRVYYTRAGEAWRIPAHKMLWSMKQRWDGTQERLWSMLFGYEDWQTDFWIAYNRERSGAWSGIPIYCSVNAAQLIAVESVGFRAFPPVPGTPLVFAHSDERPTENAAAGLISPGDVALLHVNVAGLFLIEIERDQTGPRYTVPVDRLAEFNKNIIGRPELVSRRG